MIIFDLDGTLLDSNGLWKDVDREFLGARGLTPSAEYERVIVGLIFPTAAVLIRGLLPRYNIDIISENRFGCKAGSMTAYQGKNFLNGPGKVCAGLRIDRSLNGLPHGSPDLFLCDALSDIGLPDPPGDREPLEVKAGKRIGIDYAEEAIDFPWRFYL